MTAMFNKTASLSRRVARGFRRLFARLTRKASFVLAFTIAVPPFFKLAITYKSDVSEPANDNRQGRKRPGAA